MLSNTPQATLSKDKCLLISFFGRPSGHQKWGRPVSKYGAVRISRPFTTGVPDLSPADGQQVFHPLDNDWLAHIKEVGLFGGGEVVKIMKMSWALAA
jgi:hypothetical protein